MDDATGLAEALLGLDGFAVLAVDETPSEVIVTVETTADFTRKRDKGSGATATRDRGRPHRIADGCHLLDPDVVLLCGTHPSGRPEGK